MSPTTLSESGLPETGTARTTLSRRAVLVSAAGLAGAAVLPAGVAHAAPAAATVPFVLDAKVLDGGEQVVSLTLDTRRLGPIDPSCLTTDTFGVHAKAASPFEVAASDVMYNLFDGDRTVTGVRLDRNCRVVIDLHHGEGVEGGATLGYHVRFGRNVQLDLTYTITLNKPLRLRNGRRVRQLGFVQRELVNPEVDAYGYGTSSGGMDYRLYVPRGGRRSRRKDLIVWLHGGGEGGFADGRYRTNQTQMRANRGALGFSTAEAQRVFGGAYVLAPQAPTRWLDDIYTAGLMTCIEEVARRHRIDSDRIHVVGCSNGGFMAMEMAQAHPDRFASAVPICPSITPLTTDEIRRLASTPTWFVAAANDTTLPPTQHAIPAHELVPGSILTIYPDVVWNGYSFNGHWSWIYVAHNDPVHDGVRLWNWMAAQVR